MVISFRRVLGHSPSHPDLLGGGRRLHRRGKAQAAEVCHQLLQTSTAGLQGESLTDFPPFFILPTLTLQTVCYLHPPLLAGFPSSTEGSVPS